ncbi:hypothetical protein ANCDUO_23713 [Ancylostoma duodenale]|uniref:Uncharacterized protein n=1 Tax=Ancylostoma duodenale TaxID=51022 RepID=A0A0C2C8Y7_9BILA|nr:hypothetical protein ANCDUO_23713 [Ancylostoma duodenale]
MEAESPRLMTPLLSSCGYPCPEYYNPADHLIRTLAIINGQRSTCLQTISIADKRFSDDGYGSKKDRSFFSMK